MKLTIFVQILGAVALAINGASAAPTQENAEIAAMPPGKLRTTCNLDRAFADKGLASTLAVNVGVASGSIHVDPGKCKEVSSSIPPGACISVCNTHHKELKRTRHAIGHIALDVVNECLHTSNQGVHGEDVYNQFKVIVYGC